MFNNLDIDITGARPALEAIATQIDDPIVDELANRFDDIKKAIKNYNLKSTKTALNRQPIKTLMKEVDDLISKRFGMNFKHISAGGGMYGVFTVSTSISSSIAPMRTEIMKNTENYVKHCKNTGECGSLKEKRDVKDLDEDQLTLLSEVLRGTKEVEKAIGSSGILIDEQKAVIKNFPKNFDVYIVADLVGLLIRYDLTGRELTGCLFHEIGHQFTHLSQSYRKLMSVTVLLETMKNEFSKHKDRRKTAILTIKKITGKDMEKKSDSEVYTEFIAMSLSYLDVNDTYSYTDSEQLADQFVTRFGLGAELVSALDKMHRKSVELHGTPFTNLISEAITLSVIISIFMVVISGSLSLGIITAISTLGIYTLGYIKSGLMNGHDARESTYDDDITRFRRIKLDMIRQMRELELDQKEVKKIVTELNRVENILALTPDTASIFSRVGDLLPWNIDEFTATRLAKELEALSENELHVAKAKLKEYIKGN